MEGDAGVAAALLAFLEDVGDAPEVVWSAALAMVARALDEAGEARWSRFRSSPRSHLRRLRRDVAAGMKLARLATAMQEAELERDRQVDGELHARAVDAAAAARRAQTLPAQLARLEKRRRVKAGLPVENFHLRSDYPNGSAPEDSGGAGDGGE